VEGVKNILIFTCIFATAATASANTVIAVKAASCVSPPRATISVKQAGRVVVGAQVDIYEKIGYGERPAWSGSTDNSGVAQSPKLSSGEYRVFVDAGKDSGTITLKIADHDTDTTVCELNFSPPPKSESEILSDIAKEAPVVSLKEFGGIVQDENGAVIPNLRIDVYQKGAFDKVIGSIESHGINEGQEIGQFHLSIIQGEYVAFFSRNGFRKRAITFGIDRDGWDGLLVKMVIAGTSAKAPAPIAWSPKN
jgi:hypothetical protein